MWFILWSSIVKYYTEMEILNYQQRNFLEEYGPAFWDFLLCLPGVLYLRRMFRRSTRSDYDANARTPLLELPDELLLMIVELLHPVCPHRICSTGTQQRRDFASLGGTNRRIRRVMTFLLYTDVAIVRGWSRSYRALETISNSAEISSHVQTFTLAPQIKLGTEWMPAASLAPKLRLLLPKFMKLRTLHLDLPSLYASKINKALRNSSFTFPLVERVVLGPDLEFIVQHCPNVHCISGTGPAWRRYRGTDNSYFRAHTVSLITMAGLAKKVRQFELHEKWECHHLREIHRSIPQLQTLVLRGYIATENPQELLPELRAFDKLNTLVLPHMKSLNVGIQPAMRDEPFRGPNGRKLLEQARRRRREEALRAAYAVAPCLLLGLRNLERLWIGDSMLFTPVHTPDGWFKNAAFRWEEREQIVTLTD